MQKRKEKRPLGLNTRARLMAAAVIGCYAMSPAWAQLPVPVNAADPMFRWNGNQLIVTTGGDRVIIPWHSFSIGPGNRVDINQPSAASAVLNTVKGPDPSLIYGILKSNGQVWLINPNGITIGPGGMVNTAGFIASTLDVSNANFLAGKLTFAKGDVARDVVNQGTITSPSGGSVYLIGANVSNEGLITTPQGETLLAAGQTVNLIDTGTPGVKVEITGAAGNTTNLGKVLAEAGRIGMAGVIVKNSGILNASGGGIDPDTGKTDPMKVVAAGGRIFLKASRDTYVDGDGRIVAVGTQGGRVEVLGNRVAVMGKAEIDASGAYGGGSILVGGDYQGKNSDIQNAQVTYFGPNAKLTADALNRGDGGKVIVWADDTTRAYGAISARGGALAGNGGFVETSGHRYLDVNGIKRVDASATRGRNGNWLLDPGNIDIVAGAGDFAMPLGVFDAGGADSTLGDSVINSALATPGMDVTITTSSGNITIHPGVAIRNRNDDSSTHSLTLNASGDIVFGDDSTGTIRFNDGSAWYDLVLNLIAGGAITTTSPTTVEFGAYDIRSTIVNVANEKTWTNFGTMNFRNWSSLNLGNMSSGARFVNEGSVSLLDASSVVLASGGNHGVFVNKGQLQLDTSQNAFQGTSGLLKNDGGTVTVRQSTTIEGEFQQGADSSLLLADDSGPSDHSMTLGLWNAGDIQGTIDLHAGSNNADIWVEGNSLAGARFHDLSVLGNGDIYVCQSGGGVAADFSRVMAAGTTLRYGWTDNIDLNKYGTVSFSGNSIFYDVTDGSWQTMGSFFLNNAILGIKTSAFHTPVNGVYSGNVGFAVAGKLYHDGGYIESQDGSPQLNDVTLVAGWNGTTLDDLINPTASLASDLVIGTGIYANGNIRLKAGGDFITEGGTVVIRTAGDIDINARRLSFGAAEGGVTSQFGDIRMTATGGSPNGSGIDLAETEVSAINGSVTLDSVGDITQGIEYGAIYADTLKVTAHSGDVFLNGQNAVSFLDAQVAGGLEFSTTGDLTILNLSKNAGSSAYVSAGGHLGWDYTGGNLVLDDTYNFTSVGDLMLASSAGNLDYDGAQLTAFGGGIMLAAAGNLNVNSALYNRVGSLELIGRGPLVEGGPRGGLLPAANGGIALVAGGTLAINADVTATTSGTFDLLGTSYTAGIGLAGNRIEIRAGVHDQAATAPGVMLIGRNLTGDSGGYVKSDNGSIVGLLSENLALSNGANFEAAKEITLGFGGKDSTLALSAGGYLLADSANTINLAFATRSENGVMIDGVATTNSTPNGSGLFVVNHATPAMEGNGLNISYAPKPVSGPSTPVSGSPTPVSGPSTPVSGPPTSAPLIDVIKSINNLTRPLHVKTAGSGGGGGKDDKDKNDAGGGDDEFGGKPTGKKYLGRCNA